MSAITGFGRHIGITLTLFILLVIILSSTFLI